MATVAYAVVHNEPPSIFLAEDLELLHRVLALEVVARTDPALLGDRAESIREALLEERWGDATVAWIHATGTGIDVYDGKSVYGADPDGNEFEIMWMLPRAEWGAYANAAPVDHLDLAAEIDRRSGVRTAADLAGAPFEASS